MTLTVGRRVRHAYDGQRGTVVAVDRRLGMLRVEFADGTEDWCLPDDLAPTRKAAA